MSQAKPASKQLNLEGLAMETDLKSGGCPTQSPGVPDDVSSLGWGVARNDFRITSSIYLRKDVRVAEGARLESV